VTANDSRAPFLTAQDEMSLNESLQDQTSESAPDTLEVRTDSLSVLQDSLGSLRRPLVVAAAALGLVVVALAVGGALVRTRRGGAAS